MNVCECYSKRVTAKTNKYFHSRANFPLRICSSKRTARETVRLKSESSQVAMPSRYHKENNNKLMFTSSFTSRQK